MIIRESSKPNSKDISFMSSVSYKIGWRSAKGGANIALKISLTDGMCVEFETIEKLCERLNSDSFGFRPMTPKEIEQVMSDQGNRFLL